MRQQSKDSLALLLAQPGTTLSMSAWNRLPSITNNWRRVSVKQKPPAWSMTTTSTISASEACPLQCQRTGLASQERFLFRKQHTDIRIQKNRWRSCMAQYNHSRISLDHTNGEETAR